MRNIIITIIAIISFMSCSKYELNDYVEPVKNECSHVWVMTGKRYCSVWRTFEGELENRYSVETYCSICGKLKNHRVPRSFHPKSGGIFYPERDGI